MSHEVMYPPYDQPVTAVFARSTYGRLRSSATPAMTSRPGPAPQSPTIAAW